MREAVRLRVQRLCEYCQTPEEPYSAIATFSLEHIIPRLRGGDDAPSNLALSCHQCNLFKGVKIEAIDPLTQEHCRLFHPRLDSWGDHFEWCPDWTVIVGKTAIGRVTVDALRLNRSRMVELRKRLLAVKEHPATGAVPTAPPSAS